nr:hypothetical protein [Tanacetum cinerariifolium]
MWKAIERLKQGESINIQDLETNLYWEFRKFTSRDGELLELYYSRFYKMMNELVRNQYDVTNHQVNVQPNGEALRKCILSGPYKPTTILVHGVEATDNSLAVPEHTTVETPSNMSLENKAYFLVEKEAIHLILIGIGDDIYSTVDACQIAQEMREAIKRGHDPEQAQRDKDMQKNLALIAKYFKKIYKPTNNDLRTSSNSKNKNVDTNPRYKNDDHSGQFRTQRMEYGHFAKECRKPKRVKDSAYHKEKMLLCKQAEQGVPLQAKQYDWLEDTDEEVDEQELKAHYSYMAKIQEVPTIDSGTDSEPMEHV